MENSGKKSQVDYKDLAEIVNTDETLQFLQGKENFIKSIHFDAIREGYYELVMWIVSGVMASLIVKQIQRVIVFNIIPVVTGAISYA